MEWRGRGNWGGGGGGQWQNVVKNTTGLGRHTAAQTHKAVLTQLGIGPQDVGDVLGAELAHAVLAGLGYSIYEGTWIIPQIGVGPHLHIQTCMATITGGDSAWNLAHDKAVNRGVDGLVEVCCLLCLLYSGLEFVVSRRV